MTPSRLATQSAYYALVKGLLKRFVQGDTFTLGGQTYTRDELVALFSRVEVTMKDSDGAHARWLMAVAAEKEQLKKAHAVRLLAQQYLRLLYGRSTSALSDFGVDLPKKGKKTPLVKMQAAAKAKETRKLRGTMGKKQKKAIKG